MRTNRHLRVLLAGPLLALAAVVAQAASAPSWPELPLPPGAKQFAMGEQMVINGVPSRVSAVVTESQDAQGLAQWYRQQFGDRRVENTVKKNLVIAQGRGDYFVTVQIEPTSHLSAKATVAWANLRAARESEARYLQQTKDWLANWPSGTRLVNNVSSVDAGNNATTRVLVNTQDERVNRDYLARVMATEGMQLERASDADLAKASKPPSRPDVGQAMWFRGKGKEAIATLSHDGAGRTQIVINTVTSMNTYEP